MSTKGSNKEKYNFLKKKVCDFIFFISKKMFLYVRRKIILLYKNPVAKFCIKILFLTTLILVLANQIDPIKKKKGELGFSIKSRIEKKYNLKCDIQNGHHILPPMCDGFKMRKIIVDVLKSKFKTKRLKSLPTLRLKIKKKDFNKLKKLRDQSVGLIEIKHDTKVWFPAKVIDDDNFVHKTRLRLKGDATDHIDHEYKWSFRIKTKGKDTINGFRVFSIQHPKTRAYLDDLFYSEMMIRNDILSPRIYFANVYVNGNSIGIMQVEEFFSKELLESQGKKEGLIVKSDDLFVSEIKLQKKDGSYSVSERRAPPMVTKRDLRVLYPKSLTVNDDDLVNLISLFRSFKDGKIELDQMFDVEKLAKYYAITQIIGTNSLLENNKKAKYYHGLMWHNTVMYYNPITQKIEMISYDNNVGALDFSSNNITHPQKYDFGSDLIDIFFKDKGFERQLEKYIIDISDKILNTNRYDDIFDKINNYYYPFLKSEFAYLQPINIDQFKKRARFVRKFFLDKRKVKAKKKINYTQTNTWKDKKEIRDAIKDLRFILRGYNIKTPKRNQLEIVNVFNRQIEITDIYARNKDDKEKEKLLISTSLPFLISPNRKNNSFITYKNPSFRNYDIIIKAKISGIDKIFKHKVTMNYALPATKNPIPTSSVEKQLATHRFLSTTEYGNKKTLNASEGRWIVSDYLIVPKDYTLRIPKGTILSFKYDKGIISYGNLIMEGTEKQPIILKGFGKNAGWKGIFVLQSKDKSILSNVKIYNTNGMSHTNENGAKWELTGSNTFYESDVELNNVSIENNYAEDALNIVNSDFVLNNITIKNTVSDAFDSDFSSGKIIGGLLETIGTAGGGDGIDFSGSEVTVEGTSFDDVRDKAVSVGENSNLTARNLTIKNSNLAFASKDGSKLTIYDSIVDNVKFCGLMSYKKKLEYSGASIVGTNILFVNTKTEARVQKGNEIILNGQKIKTEDIDVENLYQTEMKKKE